MPLSTQGRAAAYAQQTDQNFIYLVTVDHADLPETLRFWCGTQKEGEELVSNGNTYIAFPFEIAFPPSLPDQPPQCRVVISAVSHPDPDLDIVSIIRTLTSAPTIGMTVVLADQPDVIEIEAPAMQLKSVDFDRLTIEGTLGYEDLLGSPFPAGSHSPSLYPGLFA
jgi:hypothetical protein